MKTKLILLGFACVASLACSGGASSEADVATADSASDASQPRARIKDNTTVVGCTCACPFHPPGRPGAANCPPSCDSGVTCSFLDTTLPGDRLGELERTSCVIGDPCQALICPNGQTCVLKTKWKTSGDGDESWARCVAP